MPSGRRGREKLSPPFPILHRRRRHRQLVVVIAGGAGGPAHRPHPHHRQHDGARKPEAPARGSSSATLAGSSGFPDRPRHHFFRVSSRKISIRLMLSTSASPCHVWPSPGSTTTSALPPFRCSRSAIARA